MAWALYMWTTLCPRTAPARLQVHVAHTTRLVPAQTERAPADARPCCPTRVHAAHARTEKDSPGRVRARNGQRPEILSRFRNNVVKQFEHQTLDLAAACIGSQFSCAVSTLKQTVENVEEAATLNPKPYTLNPKPETRNPKP